MTAPWTALRAAARARFAYRPTHERLTPDRLTRMFVVLAGVSILGVTAWHAQLARDLVLQVVRQLGLDRLPAAASADAAIPSLNTRTQRSRPPAS